MNLPLIKMLGSVLVVAIYFALVLAGGAIMGINVIED